MKNTSRAHFASKTLKGKKFEGESVAVAVVLQPPTTGKMTRASFPRAATISFLCCAALAVPSLVQASSIAIISEPDDRSDAISKVIGALCEKKRGAHDEEGDAQGFCRHFQNAVEVSSILARSPGAFDAIITEVCWCNFVGAFSFLSPSRSLSFISLSVFISLTVSYFTFSQQDRDHAMHVADFAARAGVPVVRLAYRIEDIDPAFERPAVLVLEASPPEESQNYALKSIPYFTTEKIEELSGEALATLLRSMLGISTDVVDALVSSSSSSTARQPAFTCLNRSFTETMQHPSTVLSDDADSAPLGLTMIVKDEAGTIGETVRSAAPHIDYWTIMDTGSTDGTQDVIRGNFSTIPGQLIEHPFSDFATTRNDALRAHGARTAYTFMPDADFTFENMWRLRMIAWRLEQECRFWSAHICGKSMRVIRKTIDMELQMQVVFPTSQHDDALGSLDGWHYSYPVHEVSALGRDNAGEYIVVPGDNFKMRFMDGKVFHTKSEQRWRDFDIRILEAEKLKRPNDTRVSFYLARTYNQVGDNELALAEFQRRIDLGGWYEEVFHSLLDQGRILTRMGRDPTSKFKEAFELVPNRAEPLYELAAWEQRQVNACDREKEGLWLEACRFQHRALGFTYAKHAAALPYPSHSTLFLLSRVYERDAALQLVVHGYFLADLAADVFRRGKNANDRLVSRFPGVEPHASNLEWYEKLEQKIKRELATAAVVADDDAAAAAGAEED